MFRMTTRLSRPLAIVGVFAMLSWGCGGSDGSGPTDPDPTEGCDACPSLAVSAQQMHADFVASNTALGSSLALADAMTIITSENGAGGADAIRHSTPDLRRSASERTSRQALRATDLPWATGRALGGRQAAPNAPGILAALPITASSIPPQYQGATFVWDLGTGAYAEDPDAPALAPPEGLRFRIYDIAANGAPAEPLDDIGFTDLEDDSFVTASDALQYLVTALTEGTDGSGFSFELDGLTSSEDWNLTEVGALFHPTGELDYAFGMHATFGQFDITSLDLDIAFQAPGVQGSLIADFGPNAAGSQTVFFQSGQDEVEIVLIFNTSGALQAGSEATVNGRETATISGQLSSFSLSGVQSPNAMWEPVAGSGASTQEVAALKSLLLELEAFLLVLEDLFWFGFDVQSGPLE